MDKQLLETFTQLSQQNGVIGYACADESGLCLKAHGNKQASNTGFYKSLVDKSKFLSKSDEPANIVIETDSANIYIQQNQKITLAVTKLP